MNTYRTRRWKPLFLLDFFGRELAEQIKVKRDSRDKTSEKRYVNYGPTLQSMMIPHLLPIKWEPVQSVDNYKKGIASNYLVVIDEMKMQFETLIKVEPLGGGR